MTQGPAIDVDSRATDALLRLAADRPWTDITLRDIARAAEISFADLYGRAGDKRALLRHLSRRYDRAALELSEADDQPAAHDRLFEAMMARLEAMAADKPALVAIARAEPLGVAAALPRTVRALAESCGVDTGGLRGAARMAALVRVWARLLQVWRDDEGALNRTMAEADSRLKRADARLRRIGAGF